MLMTPKITLKNEFTTFMNQLKNQQQLDQIIINECYVILNNQKDFQPKLKELKKLNKIKIQIIILTITLPPTKKQKWMEKMWSKKKI